MCIGEGPVIHVMPLDMDWRQTPVLTDTPKTVRLSNESLIPAKFTAHMVSPENSVELWLYAILIFNLEKGRQ